MNCEMGRKVEMFKESGNSFYYQREADFQPCYWVTVDLRLSRRAMWHWPQGHWWYFKAVLCCLVPFFFFFFFSRRQGQSQGTKGQATLVWEAIFQKAVAHKHFYQHILWNIILCQKRSCAFLLHPEFLARLLVPSSRHICWTMKELWKLVVKATLLKMAIWLWVKYFS